MKTDVLAGRQPTILDVAKHAGVSKSTVSNVVRDFGAVSPETRSRVLKAIEELGYRPNVLARQLAQQRTAIVGVIFGDFANPFHAEMVKQIEQHADQLGYRTMFVNAREGEAAETAAIESLLEYRVAGLIFLAHSESTEHIRWLLEDRVPVVFLTCRSSWGDVVTVDDEKGAEIATRHLVDLGHRRIAYIADPIREDAADRARQVGYLGVIGEAKLEPLVLHWPMTAKNVLRDKRAVPLEHALTGPDRVTAVVSSNDFGAIELLDFADRTGIRVPEDLSIVGFDDVAISGLARINLTTVAQPQEKLALLAIETLATRIDGAVAETRLETLVEPHLVVRGTTAPARQA